MTRVIVSIVLANYGERYRLIVREVRGYGNDCGERGWTVPSGGGDLLIASVVMNLGDLR